MEANILGFEKSYTMYFFMNPWYLTSPRFALPKLKISRIEHNDTPKLKIISNKTLHQLLKKKLLLRKILRNTRWKIVEERKIVANLLTRPQSFPLQDRAIWKLGTYHEQSDTSYIYVQWFERLRTGQPFSLTNDSEISIFASKTSHKQSVGRWRLY